MAVTVTKVARNVTGNLRQVIVDITMDSSYATGGETLSATDLGLKTVLTAQLGQKTVGTTMRHFQYDLANGKILAFNSGASGSAESEVASTTDLSTITVRGTFVGR